MVPTQEAEQNAPNDGVSPGWTGVSEHLSRPRWCGVGDACAVDTLQLHSECLLPRKDVKYEFVVWQNSAIPPWPGDLSVAI